MLKTFVIALLALLALMLAGCGYNTLQRGDQDVKASWSEVINQYQRRADLVPNLVKVVQADATFEQTTLRQVVDARARVGSIQATPALLDDPQALARFEQAQGQLGGALSRLLAVSENYPQLQANAGLEGALPDAVANRILGEVVEPRLRAGDVAGGLDAGTDAMIAVVDGEPLPADSPQSTDDGRRSLQWLVLAALGVGALLRRLLGPGIASILVGTAATTIAWWWTGELFIAALSGAGCALATWFGVARWWPGGGRGGGDGGTGFGGRGGRFGGGGASGRW